MEIRNALCSIVVMNKAADQKTGSGSVKLDPKTHKEMVDLCKKKGWVINVFATETIRVRVAAIKDQDKKVHE